MGCVVIKSLSKRLNFDSLYVLQSLLLDMDNIKYITEN